MCPDCLAEYRDPLNRRFHSETNSCPVCGPHVTLLTPSGDVIATGDAAIAETAKRLAVGEIAAIKGVGGFHLACDAMNVRALALLRERKGRGGKPFAIMVRDTEAARSIVKISAGAESLLSSPVAPIVIAKRQPGCRVPVQTAPGNDTLGVFVAYTPLHRMLFKHAEPLGLHTLVMTSGNLSDEPIAIGNAEALERLGGLADVMLVHDREILCRADDSIFREINSRPVVFRRARGVVPEGVRIIGEGPDVLALGGELKSTVAIASGRQAWLSPHIGDLETAEAFDHFTESIDRLQEFCDRRPDIVACDMHPEYLSTKHAATMTGIRVIHVQHHHAHIAACMAENGVSGPVIGVSFDGTGYGPDGTVWGGEFMVADLAGFTRVGHLRQVRMPGGARAIKEPFRMAVAYLDGAFGSFRDKRLLEVLKLAPQEFETYSSLGRSGVASPLTSSAGRLFDAVSALVGLERLASFEGQAAIALECAAAASPVQHELYTVPVTGEAARFTVDTVELFRQIALDALRGEDYRELALRFHNSLGLAVASACAMVRDAGG
ncbi:MAG: carbamoyltransferase HypF, partial [Myxococcota bacterium]